VLVGGNIAGSVAVAVALALPGFGYAACGGDSGDGDDEDRIADVVSRFQTSFANGDLHDVCAIVTPAAYHHAGDSGHDDRESCQREMRKIVQWMRRGGSGPVAGRELVGVDVEGDSAVATIGVGAGERVRLPLARVDGDWKVDAVYGDIPAGRQEDKL
jgi:hypothetical protein